MDFSLINVQPQFNLFKTIEFNSDDIAHEYEFTVATWNILCQSYLFENVYSTSSWIERSVEERVAMIMSYIEQLNVDILCLQECFGFELYFEKPLKTLGYDCLYVKRPCNREDGCLIAWNTRKFILKNNEVLNFNDLAKYPFIDNMRYMKDSIAIIVGIAPIDSECKEEDIIYVATTHIYWNPNYDDVKVAQTATLLHHLHKKSKASNRVILCGDFNSTPDSGLVAFVKYGIIKLDEWLHCGLSRGYSYRYHNELIHRVYPGYPDEEGDELFNNLRRNVMEHPLELKDVFHSCRIQFFTTWMPQFCGVLDYVFVSKSLKILATCNLPTPKELDGRATIPSPNFPSDHLFLACRLGV